MVNRGPRQNRMIWARPSGASAAPLIMLAAALCTLLFNPFGLQAALVARLLAAYAGAAPYHAGSPLFPFHLAEGGWLLAFGAGALWLRRYGLVWCGLAIAVGIAGAVWGGWVLFLKFAILLDSATTGVGLALVFVAAALAWAMKLGMVRISLRQAFANSLPHASIEKIARTPSLLKSDGELRECSYLVCGVRGLAGLGSAFQDEPTTFTRLMQQVVTPLLDQALAHGGTIDRLTPDGFAAFWNAPLDDPNHAIHACEAASSMSITARRVSDELVQWRRANGQLLPIVEIGVGVATGRVIAGGFGGHGRMGYSVNGEAVSLASRIQALSHQYGPALIVSAATRQAAERNFAFLEIDTVATGASDPPVTLYAILGNSGVKASPKFRALTTFHDHIFQSLRKQQWHQARALIEQCRRLSGASPRLYDLHLKRVGYFEHNPPGENWDGAFRPILK
jgi:adenylate cyclase